jgi:hypothetical protein
MRVPLLTTVIGTVPITGGGSKESFSGRRLKNAQTGRSEIGGFYPPIGRSASC